MSVLVSDQKRRLASHLPPAEGTNKERGEEAHLARRKGERSLLHQRSLTLVRSPHPLHGLITHGLVLVPLIPREVRSCCCGGLEPSPAVLQRRLRGSSRGGGWEEEEGGIVRRVDLKKPWPSAQPAPLGSAPHCSLNSPNERTAECPSLCSGERKALLLLRR